MTLADDAVRGVRLPQPQPIKEPVILEKVWFCNGMWIPEWVAKIALANEKWAPLISHEIVPIPEWRK
jgi:hypothetical protein